MRRFLPLLVAALALLAVPSAAVASMSQESIFEDEYLLLKKGRLSGPGRDAGAGRRHGALRRLLGRRGAVAARGQGAGGLQRRRPARLPGGGVEPLRQHGSSRPGARYARASDAIGAGPALGFRLQGLRSERARVQAGPEALRRLRAGAGDALLRRLRGRGPGRRRAPARGPLVVLERAQPARLAEPAVRRSWHGPGPTCAAADRYRRLAAAGLRAVRAAGHGSDRPAARRDGADRPRHGQARPARVAAGAVHQRALLPRRPRPQAARGGPEGGGLQGRKAAARERLRPPPVHQGRLAAADREDTSRRDHDLHAVAPARAARPTAARGPGSSPAGCPSGTRSSATRRTRPTGSSASRSSSRRSSSTRPTTSPRASRV